MRAFIEYLKALFFRESKNVLRLVEADLKAELIRILTNHKTIVPSYKAGSVSVNKLIGKKIVTDKVKVINGDIEVNPEYLKQKGVSNAQARKMVDKIKREINWDKAIR